MVGLLDAWGKLKFAVEPRWAAAESFSDGLALVREIAGGPQLFIDKKGAMAFEARFDFAAPFHQGLADVNLGREASYITPPGAEVWRGPRS